MNLMLQVSGNSHCPQEGSCGGFKPDEEHATPRDQANQRILVIDDNPAIHSDLRRVLTHSHEPPHDLDLLEEALLGRLPAPPSAPVFELDTACQGEEGVRRVESAVARGQPYAVALVDMRMPPGWDGLETIERLWGVDPDLQVVICTAYSDYSWYEIRSWLGHTDRLLILKKPFDVAEVLQAVHSLARKWELQRALTGRLRDLDERVRERTAELERANRQLQKEIAERERMEQALCLAQKLEAVGQLTAGIAHEINTPIQYVGDSLHFLRTTFKSFQKLIDGLREAQTAVAAVPGGRVLAEWLAQLEKDADLPYLSEQVPCAFDRTFDGLDRVAAIVSAMKEFVHLAPREKSPANLNRAIETTLTLVCHEYKYVADVRTDFGDLPLVECHLGDLYQVFLNLVISAAHAIADARQGEDERGEICIRTRRDAGHVVIEFRDTAYGIPEAVRYRMLAPFSTAEEVDGGMDRGFVIMHSIVVDKHAGELGFERNVGCGATFTIRLPISASETGGED